MSSPIFLRRHYEVVARILGQNNADPQTVRDFIRAFATDNPHFDSVKFVEAVTRANHGRSPK